MTTWCFHVKKLLTELHLGHLWESEEIEELKDWSTLVMACVKQKELDSWKLGLLEKPKLRFYRVLKTELAA